jgi:hypothetical protein
MNTPPRSAPKRYSKPEKLKGPLEGFHKELEGDFAVALGQIISIWPHIEDVMIWIFEDLLGAKLGAPSRQIFRSITAQQSRIKVMRAMLERSPINQNKSADDLSPGISSKNG